MARGQIVADGPPTEIKARVGGRTIRATLPGVERSALEAIPGVANAEQRGEAFVIKCADAILRTPHCVRCSTSTPKLATSKCAGRASRKPSSI